MTVYTAQEIFDFAREAGFAPDQAATWTAIALAESAARPTPSTTGASTRWGCGRSTSVTVCGRTSGAT